MTMSEHYYPPSPSSKHDEHRVEISALGEALSCATDAGVFSRGGLDVGTRILIEALPTLSGRVLDLGCGWGALGGLLAKKYPDAESVLTDVNERAVALAERNIRQNGLKNARAVRGDGFESVEGAFDWILTNPPIRAGKAVIYGLFRAAQRHLAEGGRLVVVIRKQQGAKSAEAFLSEIFPRVEAIDKSGGYWVLMADMRREEDIR